MMTPMTRSQLVTSYIESGFALVPIPLGSKGPVHKGWNKRNRVIKSSAFASSITGNVGIAHAYCTPHPTVALDLDDFQLATVWFRNRAIELNDLLSADDSVIIESGRANRKKLLYRLPAGTAPLATAQYTDTDSNEMVFEFRCASKSGTTFQDVLPPSTHPVTGKPYYWSGNGHYSRLPEIPKALLDIWLELIAKQPQTARNLNTTLSCPIPGTPPARAVALSPLTLALRGNPETPRTIATVRHMLTFINANCDYTKYRAIVWAVADTGWSCAYDLVHDWSITAPGRFDEGVLRTIFKSFSYAGGIRYGTLVHYAREGGWNG